MFTERFRAEAVNAWVLLRQKYSLGPIEELTLYVKGDSVMGGTATSKPKRDDPYYFNIIAWQGRVYDAKVVWVRDGETLCMPDGDWTGITFKFDEFGAILYDKVPVTSEICFQGVGILGERKLQCKV